MNKMRILIVLLAFVAGPVSAFDLATEISRSGESATVASIGYAKLNLVKLETNLTGVIAARGTLSVEGTANIVMWVNVDNRYYFSRMPELQSIKDKKNLPFEIPFDAGGKVATEVVIEVELLGAGSVTIERVNVANH